MERNPKLTEHAEPRTGLFKVSLYTYLDPFTKIHLDTLYARSLHNLYSKTLLQSKHADGYCYCSERGVSSLLIPLIQEEILDELMSTNLWTYVAYNTLH